MSVDLKRCQALAEPLGWKICTELRDRPVFNQTIYRLRIGHTVCDYDSLAPIRERLAKEYRERQVRLLLDAVILTKATHKQHVAEWNQEIDDIITELSVVEEPTIVERLKEERDRPLDLCSYEQLFLDALIQFGERLDAIERGKE